jgi:hypothetical protein
MVYVTLGELKIAEKLARAGMHVGKSTVERIFKERPVEPPPPTQEKPADEASRLWANMPLGRPAILCCSAPRQRQ